MQVSKTDVEAALKVLNFAIYHKELTEMEEREEERERTRQADHDSGAHHGHDATRVPWVPIKKQISAFPTLVSFFFFLEELGSVIESTKLTPTTWVNGSQQVESSFY